MIQKTKKFQILIGVFVLATLNIVAGYLAVSRQKLEPSGGPVGILGVSVDVPTTNYTIPSGAIFMSPSGSDTNTGSESSPIRTLSKAVSLSPSSGGTVVLRGGLYRDGKVSSLNKSITFQAYPGEQPWFDGTDVVTSWTNDGDGKWSVSWNTPNFCAAKYNNFDGTNFDAGAGGPCHHPDQSLDPSNLMAWDPQMVFKDETYIHQVSTRAEASGDNFYYDRTLKRVVIGFNPSGHTVELTARAQAIYIEAGSPTGGAVKGIGFKRFATNEYSGNRTHGALLVNVQDYTLENSVFTQMAGAGAFFANPKNATIRDNYFVDNGFNGLDGNGKNALSGNRDDALVENNVFRNNNTEDFGTGCSASCAAAGSKFAHMVGMTVKNNTFEDNNGAGFWCDLYCTDVKIYNNVAKNNAKSGLYYEVSNNGIIASNLAVGNGGEGIKNGSATTRIYNNTSVNNRVGFLIYDDSRAASGSEIAPDTVDVDFVNNVVYGGTNIIQVYNAQTNANQIFSRFNRNAYFRPSGSPARLIEWRTGGAPTPTYNSVSAFNAATGNDADSFDITTGSDPFFMDSSDDFRIRNDSDVFRVGDDIPADIASLIGVSTTDQDLGAIVYPGVGPTISPATPPPPPPPPPSAPSDPVITSFDASPSTITQGEKSTLSWSVSDADSCVIQTTGSSDVDVSGDANWETPTLTSVGTRTYTLVCSNSVPVSDSASTDITVEGAVVAPDKPTLTSSKSSIKLGEPVVISWSSAGATSCIVSPSNITATGNSGNKTYTSLTATQTFSVTCANTAGSTTSDELTVTVDITQTVTEEELPPEERQTITTEDNITISNGAASETVTGDTVLDPTIVTDKSKQEKVEKVEYYLGEKLIYTATKPPYALDTTILPNGTHTITARTYMKDGTIEEVTRVLGVENEKLIEDTLLNDVTHNSARQSSHIFKIVLLTFGSLTVATGLSGVFIWYRFPALFVHISNNIYAAQNNVKILLATINSRLPW
jgi:hypothetical protein